jgi:hypothetical protein
MWPDLLHSIPFFEMKKRPVTEESTYIRSGDYNQCQQKKETGRIYLPIQNRSSSLNSCICIIEKYVLETFTKTFTRKFVVLAETTKSDLSEYLEISLGHMQPRFEGLRPANTRNR